MNPLMIVLAVLPAVFLLVFIYRKDTVEKEPAGLLLNLFALGALTIITALLMETGANTLLLLFLPSDSLIYKLIDNFLVIALIEEAGKYVVLKTRTWKNPHFNYMFDAVVYAVVVSMGYAMVENILFLLNGSLELAIARALLSVPGHAIFGVYMGYFYGLAKRAERMGDTNRCLSNLRYALIAPVIIHGLYDFFITAGLTFVFFAFEIAITILAVRHTNRLSKEDAPV